MLQEKAVEAEREKKAMKEKLLLMRQGKTSEGSTLPKPLSKEKEKEKEKERAKEREKEKKDKKDKDKKDKEDKKSSKEGKSPSESLNDHESKKSEPKPAGGSGKGDIGGRDGDAAGGGGTYCGACGVHTSGDMYKTVEKLKAELAKAKVMQRSSIVPRISLTCFHIVSILFICLLNSDSLSILTSSALSLLFYSSTSRCARLSSWSGRVCIIAHSLLTGRQTARHAID